MLEALVQKYRRKGVLVDSNLLVGLLIGRLNPKHLANCRATKAFTQEDYEILRGFVTNFELLITTPHILTEVSNLAGRLPESLHAEFRSMFRIVIEKSLKEQNVPAAAIARDGQFLRFGITDTAITRLASGSFLVLTDELALYGLLQSKRIDSINFNHLRTAYLD